MTLRPRFLSCLALLSTACPGDDGVSVDTQGAASTGDSGPATTITGGLADTTAGAESDTTGADATAEDSTAADATADDSTGTDSTGGDAVMVTVVRAGDGFGSIDDGTTLCTASSCSFMVPVGGTLSLVAAPRDALNAFVDWSGACAGAGLACDLTPTRDTTIDARWQLVGNVAFVSAQTVTVAELQAGAPAAGTFFEKADAWCTAEATSAGLHGAQYVAWVAGTGTGDTLAERVGAARAWVRTDGRPVADTFASMVSGSLLNPILFDESGARAETVGVSGLDLDGTPSASGGDCLGWTSSAGDQSASAGTSNSTQLWAAGLSVPCDGSFSLYCVGVEATAPLADTLAETGRRAFMTTEAFDPASGRDAADALCLSEAEGVLAGSFLAALGTSTQTGPERFDLTGEIWVRPDGQPIVADAADLDGGALLTSVHQAADGSEPPIFPLGVWTLYGLCAGDPALCCDDWSTNTGNVTASERWGLAFQPATTRLCSSAVPIVCLEE